MVWVMVLSMVVWAPLLEETMFRGALFRYLHPKLRVWGTVLATAAVFGMVHPYTTSGLVNVASMGVVFGLLRQWRGSLIAPMVAHAIHNGVIALVTVLMISAISSLPPRRGGAAVSAAEWATLYSFFSTPPRCASAHLEAEAL